MNGIWRNDTVTYEGLQEPPPVATALLFLGWEGGSKLQHREPQTRRTSGSRAAKSSASSELLAYPWRWLALACSCHTAYVRTSLGMAPTIPYCQILLRAGGRVGVLDSGCSFTEWHPRAPCQVALLRSTEPLRQSLLTAGLSLADSTHLERYTHKPCNLCPPSLTPTITKAVCFTVLQSLPSKAGVSQHPLLTTVLCVRRNDFDVNEAPSQNNLGDITRPLQWVVDHFCCLRL